MLAQVGVFVIIATSSTLRRALLFTPLLTGPLLLLANAILSVRALPRGSAIDEILITPDGPRLVAEKLKQICRTHTYVALIGVGACLAATFGLIVLSRIRPEWYKTLLLSQV